MRGGPELAQVQQGEGAGQLRVGRAGQGGRQVGDITMGHEALTRRIPVMATWDDHDFAANNQGKEYPCTRCGSTGQGLTLTRESQEEFVRHFNIPPTDPIHWYL